MSYGWLTESSCIPKPGKEILSVSKQSLVSLKALLVEEEADKLKRRHTKAIARNANKKSAITNIFDKKKKLCRENFTKDKVLNSITSEDPLFFYDTLERKLEKKSEIYDSLVSGKLEIKDVPNILDPSSKGKNKLCQGADQSCLDLEKKHQCYDMLQDDRRHFSKDEVTLHHTKDGTGEKEPSQVLQQLRDRLEKLSSKKRTE